MNFCCNRVDLGTWRWNLFYYSVELVMTLKNNSLRFSRGHLYTLLSSSCHGGSIFKFFYMSFAFLFLSFLLLFSFFFLFLLPVSFLVKILTTASIACIPPLSVTPSATVWLICPPFFLSSNPSYIHNKPIFLNHLPEQNI